MICIPSETKTRASPFTASSFTCISFSIIHSFCWHPTRINLLISGDRTPSSGQEDSFKMFFLPMNEWKPCKFYLLLPFHRKKRMNENSVLVLFLFISSLVMIFHSFRRTRTSYPWNQMKWKSIYYHLLDVVVVVTFCLFYRMSVLVWFLRETSPFLPSIVTSQRKRKSSSHVRYR